MVGHISQRPKTNFVMQRNNVTWRDPDDLISRTCGYSYGDSIGPQGYPTLTLIDQQLINYMTHIDNTVDDPLT
jgi:hypothetical protein